MEDAVHLFCQIINKSSAHRVHQYLHQIIPPKKWCTELDKCGPLCATVWCLCDASYFLLWAMLLEENTCIIQHAIEIAMFSSYWSHVSPCKIEYTQRFSMGPWLWAMYNTNTIYCQVYETLALFYGPPNVLLYCCDILY